MATRSSILAWRIPLTEEPGWLWFIVLQRVRHDWSNLACTPKIKLKSHFFWGILCWLFCTVTFLITPTVIIAYISHLALTLSFDIAYTTILNCYLTLYGHEFEWTPGVRDGQRGMVCCQTQLSNWTELNWTELRIALPISTRPSFPLSQSLPSGSFHSLLSFSIRGQTEWKPQSQKTNQSDHMDHTLV